VSVWTFLLFNIAGSSPAGSFQKKKKRHLDRREMSSSMCPSVREILRCHSHRTGIGASCGSLLCLKRVTIRISIVHRKSAMYTICVQHSVRQLHHSCVHTVSLIVLYYECDTKSTTCWDIFVSWILDIITRGTSRHHSNKL